MTRYLGMLLLLLLGACSSTGPVTFNETSETPHLVWPATPEISRIKFITAFKNAEDLGFEKNLFRRLLDLLTGSEEHSLSRPYTIAVNENRIAVADPDAAIVHLFELDSKSYRRIDHAGNHRLESPIGVSLAKNRLFIADSKLNKVFILNSSLKTLHMLKGFLRPTSLAFDPKLQRLYIADTLAHEVLVFDSDGNLIYKIGERGEQDLQFNFPSHLAFFDQRLFVNDTMNFRIQSFDNNGLHLKTFGKQGNASGYFTQSKGLALDSDGHIYVADALANRIQIFDQSGAFLLEFGGVGDAPGNFRMPSGLAIWDDKIFVADSYNQRIQVFQYLKVGN
ncbi:MAG: 6-bladed beta-propeller [Candidatus Thiodiazotropha endolucinida]|uniref:NHL repeat protein n=1 Tax=Candidatus Thiodiazotropha endolucinida TaxID=1655433 RepID=A0A7Z0VMC7_9GAMM|nr:6-bladed beta-propeller [Candidatus Thiodiazotropha endolucinida]ODJ88148.1 NHL repeat protein [Candidatus Thiodiazotropha endolucinida]